MQAWIPHFQKMHSKEWEPIITKLKEAAPDEFPLNIDDYLADPPLTEGGKKQAAALPELLVKETGIPHYIFYATTRRAYQTAQPAIEKFGQHYNGWFTAIGLNILSQADSGEVYPEHPDADSDGFVVYGPKTTEKQWFQWFQESRRIIQDVSKASTVWVFTHSPLVAAGLWTAENAGGGHPEHRVLHNLALDKRIKPYCLFYDAPGGVWFSRDRFSS